MLSQETSLEFCESLDLLRKTKDVECKLLYQKEEEKEACESLRQMVEARDKDCLNLYLGKKTNSVKGEEVEKNCKILEAASK